MKRRIMVTVLSALAIVGGFLVVPLQSRADADPVFITSCDESHRAQVDPIVAPGKRSEHMHEFFGNKTTDSTSTYKSMIDGGTTCSLGADTAGYWVPTLIGRDGSEVRAQSINAYYRAVGALDSVKVTAYPPDLRMVASHYFYHCGDTGSGQSTPGDCGSQSLHVSITFPACWDGKNTDSPDHASHMAYQTGRGCPSSHPVAVPRLVMVVRYIGVHDARGYTLSSGDATTMHADFWNTWQQRALEKLVDDCLNTATATCDQVSD
jgi:Domain of unknown function (DUF1996)